MSKAPDYKRLLLLCGFMGAALPFFAIADLVFGSVALSWQQVIQALLREEEVPAQVHILVWEARLPRMLTALLAGASLAVSGLLMQSFFRNPVAGPYILGISSGASLGVALLLLGGSSGAGLFFLSQSSRPSVVLAAGLGAFAALGLMAALARRIRDAPTLLLFGLMFGSFTSAIVTLLQHAANKDALRDFIFWTFGSLDHTHWPDLVILSLVCLLALCLAFWYAPSFDLLALGDDHATTSGLALFKTRLIAMLLTAALAGCVTAYCGPVAFIGVAVPHAMRLLSRRTSHRILLPLCAAGGGMLLLLCDVISRMPGQPGVLPINAITSFIGAPAVFWIILKSRRVGRYFEA